MRWHHVAVVTAAILLLPTGVNVQGQEPPVFSADSELVVLHVTVKDERGAYVSGLLQEAFSVVEDGLAQTVRVFSDTDTPVTVGLLVDSSASMHPNRRVVIAGASSFAEASSPLDEIFALAFNEDVYPVLPPTAPFTNNSTVLRAALERNVTARGRTALYDAIATGIDYLSRGTRERKVIVVLSDGGDNASQATKEASVRKALASNAVIYTIALVIPGVRDANPTLLKELAQASGGQSFRPDTDAPQEIAEALGQIARDIRRTYTIGYTSTNTARDGAFRRVRVVVRAPPGQRLVVRSRAGYIAGIAKVEP
ncbi:MAG TPA: VWA domain-containing protein [Vicinamibacterales bacterium]|nr:VWA domain-containing protein [Vicinamibacterales bacterium]